jgi:cardiolipin synthase
VKSRWIEGNHARLLENGEQFFPAVFDAIRRARHEVLLETFILFDDKVGRELRQVLLEAAARGVRIDLLLDGFGCDELTPAFLDALTGAGVRIRTFDPATRWFGIRLNVLRRMHRKILVVDGERAFVGGINYSADHLADYGAQAKQDYSVELSGPIVAPIHRFAQAAAGIAPASPWQRRGALAPSERAAGGAGEMAGEMAGEVAALFVTRDNHHHRNAIERHYRIAIRSARHSVLIANAYFFPGYLLMREMRRAARRGVDVRLILQGEPDMPIVKTAASMLYQHLRRDGVRIHEYCKRPLHGKVAVVDDHWSTVGSSNLDPLSLSLNLEANVVLRSTGFARVLRERLQYLIDNECREIEPEPPPSGFALWQRLRSTLVFHFLRRFPAWVGVLPRHAPRLELQPSPAQVPGPGQCQQLDRTEVADLARPLGHVRGELHARRTLG